MKIDSVTFREGTMEDYKNNPASPIELMMTQIVDYTQKRIAKTLMKGDTGLETMHPSMIISMLVANISINLMKDMIVATSPEQRLKMVASWGDGMRDMITSAWEVMELARMEAKPEH